MKFVKTGSIAFFGLVILIVNVAYAGFWQVENSSARPGAWIDTARHFSSDDDALRRFLDQVPVQHSGQSLQIELPMPDGSNGIFEIFESSIMAEELAAKYPQIKSYKVRGVDDPGASGRVDISPAGFRGMIFTSQGLVFIDPESGSSSSQRYKSRRVEGMGAGKGFSCASGDANLPNSVLTSNKISNRTEGGLLKFDLALSATREFVIAIYGSDLSDVSAARAAALAEMNTAITRVNEIFERDFGITLELISENDELIEVTDTGAFTNGNANLMLSENQTWVDGRIASSSYDIGHVLGAGRNGIAFTRVVCNDPNKAMGVTGYSGSSNDSFYLDFLAHELAHQFGANHSFNGTSGSCFSNRDPGTAYEPGSGTTIMSYAGSCGAEAIQFDGDATFHAGSIAEVNSFVSGISCFDINSYGNNDPTANAGANHNIPVDTAFVLEGSGVDVDGNTLSYQWDQMDAGRATTSGSLGDDFGDNALFRSYVPQDSPGRHFPALGTQLDNLSDWSEALPCTERELNFRLTVRDGTSGQATDDVVLSVDDSSGPFQITSHNSGGTIYTNSGRVTLQWDVANTDNAIVNCTAVDIDLLTFASDHSTYAVNPLVRGTINDGLASVSIPNQSSTQARFRVSCSNNIFYDISDHDLTIRGSGALVYFNTKGNDTFYNEDGQQFVTKAECRAGAKLYSESSGGGGAFSFVWLLTLLGITSGRAKLRFFIGKRTS